MIAVRACLACMFALWAMTAVRADALSDSIKDKINGVLVGHAASVADYDAAEASVNAVWAEMPLAVRHALFVTQKSSGYGIYEQRPNNEFKPGEVLNIYAEPVGYNWQSLDSGGYLFGVIADLAIQDNDGNTLFDKPEFAKLPLKSRERNKEFTLNFDVTVTGVKAGLYKVVIKLHDLTSPKTTSFSLPFKIVDGP